jgi:hypothetical protein
VAERNWCEGCEAAQRHAGGLVFFGGEALVWTPVFSALLLGDQTGASLFWFVMAIPLLLFGLLSALVGLVLYQRAARRYERHVQEFHGHALALEALGRVTMSGAH